MAANTEPLEILRHLPLFAADKTIVLPQSSDLDQPNDYISWATMSSDYGWVKAGMIFPFQEYIDRFQGQTKLYDSRPSDFHMAIEEAILAEHGHTNKGPKMEQDTSPTTNDSGVEEATGSNKSRAGVERIHNDISSPSHQSDTPIDGPSSAAPIVPNQVVSEDDCIPSPKH